MSRFSRQDTREADSLPGMKASFRREGFRGHFCDLRNRRARIMPEQVGLPRVTRRRTPGLRRAEVALLAGVTPEWYSRLEQGQDIHVSVQLLESLASVL